MYSILSIVIREREFLDPELVSFYQSMKKVFNGLKYINHKFYEKVSKRQGIRLLCGTRKYRISAVEFSTARIHMGNTASF